MKTKKELLPVGTALLLALFFSSDSFGAFVAFKATCAVRGRFGNAGIVGPANTRSDLLEICQSKLQFEFRDDAVLVELSSQTVSAPVSYKASCALTTKMGNVGIVGPANTTRDLLSLCQSKYQPQFADDAYLYSFTIE